MVIGVALVIISILVIAIWVVIEIKRMRHKVFAIILIALILFSYISFTVVIRNHDVNLKTVSGLVEASGLYFEWLGTVAGNVISVTSYAVKQDWNSVEEDKRQKEEPTGLAGFLK